MPHTRGIQKAVCTLLGRSRQAYRQQRRARGRREVDEKFVLSLVDRIRAVHPRMGARKLHHLLRPEFRRAGVRIGRDRLLEVLRRNGRLVERRRARTPHTTKFDASLPVSRNWAAGLVATGPWQVLVADITYIRTADGFAYLTLVTDRFTREIVGWHLSGSLRSEGCLKALAMAAAKAPPGTVVIFHSDRGCQFAGREFRAELKRLGWISSMTEERHCYENSVAERVNGILKQEYYLDCPFAGIAVAEREIRRTVRTYNELRPHASLGMMTPRAARLDPGTALPFVRRSEEEGRKTHDRRVGKAAKAREAGKVAA